MQELVAASSLSSSNMAASPRLRALCSSCILSLTPASVCLILLPVQYVNYCCERTEVNDDDDEEDDDDDDATMIAT